MVLSTLIIFQAHWILPQMFFSNAFFNNIYFSYPIQIKCQLYISCLKIDLEGSNIF